MRKTLIVAQSEFITLVRTKAFIVGVVLMPVIMVVSVLLVRATKDSGAPLVMAPGLVLHQADGRYTVAAEAILRGGAALPLI